MFGLALECGCKLDCPVPGSCIPGGPAPSSSLPAAPYLRPVDAPRLPHRPTHRPLLELSLPTGFEPMPNHPSSARLTAIIPASALASISVVFVPPKRDRSISITAAPPISSSATYPVLLIDEPQGCSGTSDSTLRSSTASSLPRRRLRPADRPPCDRPIFASAPSVQLCLALLNPASLVPPCRIRLY